MTTLNDPNTTGTDDLVKDSTDQSFMADVVEPSKDVPVLVDFWAPWCGPCRQLGPMIEHAVRESEGAVKLVKINIDENPGIAQQLRVQSIPAVFAFKDGQPVDGFMGALPESQIRDFIRRISGNGPSAEELQAYVEQGMQALQANDLQGASQAFDAVLQNDQKNVAALAGLARVWIQSGDLEKARQILEQVPDAERSHPAVEGAQAAIDLASGVPSDDAETAALRQKVAANASDLQARFDLAEALIAASDPAGAVDQLIAITALDREWNEQAARTLLLKVFEAEGPMSEVTRDGRRRLSSILFS